MLTEINVSATAPMIRDHLRALLAAAARAAQDAGDLPAFALPEFVVDHPASEEHGDYATNLALQSARVARRPPMQIAEAIAARVADPARLASVVVAHPGFINLTLTDRWLQAQVDAVVQAGSSFGALDLGRGARVQVEFVSANPTGPLHVGNLRGGPLGDALGNVLAAAGFAVQREYLLNDIGLQAERFGQSLRSSYLKALGLAAADGDQEYQGPHVEALAAGLVAEFGDGLAHLEGAEAAERFRQLGVERSMRLILRDLDDLGIHFDRVFAESSLVASGATRDTVEALAQRGFTDEREGAVWFKHPDFMEDRECVLLRSDANHTPTYFANDVAYHRDKLLRGFDRIVDVWGANHHGHIPRMKAAVAALGYDPERLQVLLYQQVLLKQGGEVLSMSKRRGNFVTAREVLDDVGADAVRFILLTRSADAPLEFDLELAKKQSDENPVYYVQYAHARIASILRVAQERQVSDVGGDPSLLATPAELGLVRRILRLPELVELAATKLEPHHLTHYAMDLAASFHSFYRQCRVVTDDEALTRARLKLVRAAQLALARSLGLLGVSAPERM